jgi:hypothetical protein
MASLSVRDITIGEGEVFVDVVVRLDAPSANTVTVSYSYSTSTTNVGSDFPAFGGNLTFAPGETLKSVRVQLRDDTTVEGPENFQFVLRNATGATLSRAEAEITIIDNDTIVETPRLFVDDVWIDEKQGTASFVVRLGQGLGESANSGVSVAYSTRDGTAIAGQDFVAASGTLTFAPGESVKTVVVDLIDDALAEPVERFDFVLSNPVGAAIGDGQARGEIALSDGTISAQPRISVADITASEADRFIDVPVRLHAPSANTVTVSYSYSTSTTNVGSDFPAFGGNLTFAPGETLKSVRVQLRDDTTVEGPENFQFVLRNATGATLSRAEAEITIIDNDTIVETPRLFVDDVWIDEKQGTASFVVRLGQGLGESANSGVSVAYSTRDGTAIAGQDFVAASGTLTFAPGESVKTVVVDLIDDALAEPVERFDFVLSNPVGAAIGDGQARGEIALSDGTISAQPRISVADITASEADRFIDVPVRLHAPSANTVTVSYSYSTSTTNVGSDFSAFGGNLTFAPGETLKSVRVQLRDDTTVEGPENFQFVLRNATGASLANSSAQMTILDDDGVRPLLSHGRSNDLYVIDSAAVDFLEAADGGFDTVRSSVSFTLPPSLEGVILAGNALNAVGNDAANFFRGNALNNTIDGRGGIDTVAFTGRDIDYTISGSVASWTVFRAGEGTDALLSIERLQFSNTILAFDTTPSGNTWGAYALLNAAFDAQPSPTLLGQWTAQLDQLGSLEELARAMIQFYAPGVPNEALVAHLWSTVVEQPLSDVDLAGFVGLIESGALSQASLMVLAATHPLNTAEFVQLVGQPTALDPMWFPIPGGWS